MRKTDRCFRRCRHCPPEGSCRPPSSLLRAQRQGRATAFLREKEVEPVPCRMAVDTIPVWDIAEDLLFGQVCILVIQLDADPIGDRAAGHDKAQHRAEKQHAEMITSSTGHGRVDCFLSLYGWRDGFGCGRLSRETRGVRGASGRA